MNHLEREIARVDRENARPRRHGCRLGPVPRPNGTPGSLRVLGPLREYMAANGWAPTLRELMTITGLRSANAVTEHLCRLERDGYLVWVPMKARCIRLTDKGRAA